MKLPRLIGHRGAAAHAPENTLAGLRRAAALGLSWVEVDAQLSADGIPFLFHDDRLQRTVGDRRKIAEVAAAELERLDAGSWFAPEFAGEAPPRLETALPLLFELGLKANVEIKPSPGLARETAVATVAVLRAHWPSEAPPPLLSSFKVEALEEAQRLWPEAPRGYLVESLPADWQATAERLECLSVHLWHPQASEVRLAAIKAAGFQVAAYTVNGLERAQQLRRWGLDCLITDDPVALAGLAAAA